eukprot:gb/GECG01007601.1/.p1 GENE.gb/GECG01007601.1/~~gb/GECG01007601.1/.p1  ORF type:complete len:307 (+),score=55.90 gb/GECG01007601.1/:1-921(+)
MATGAPGGGGYPSIHVQPENIQFILNRNAQVIREWVELNNMKAAGQVTAEIEQRIQFLYQTLSESLQMLAALAEARESPALIPSERILAGLPPELVSEELRALCLRNIQAEREMAKQQEQQRQQQMMMMQQQQPIPPHGGPYQAHGHAMGRHFPGGGVPSSHGQQPPKMEHPGMQARSATQHHHPSIYSQHNSKVHYHGSGAPTEYPMPPGGQRRTTGADVPSFPQGIDIQQQQQYGVSGQSQLHQQMEIPTSAPPQMQFDPYGRGGADDAQRMAQPPPSTRGMGPPDRMAPGDGFGGGGGYQFFD